MRGEREERESLCRSVFRKGTEPDREAFAEAMAGGIALLEGGVILKGERKKGGPAEGDKGSGGAVREGK